MTRVAATETGYQVVTDRGVWNCATVVLASGACNVAKVPAIAEAIPPSVASVTPLTYRSPDQLDDAGVLVVGGSATGVQLADEIHRSGRHVTLAVGEHVAMPRTYRGRDIFWWMEAAGLLDERYDEVDDLIRARHVPSPQLIGTPERRSLDLNSLAALGVEIVGRLGTIRDGVALFSGGLANTCRLADLKLNRLLDRFDEWERRADAGLVEPPHRFEQTKVACGRHPRGRSSPAQHRHDRLGDRLPSRPFVARRAGARPQGSSASRRRRRQRRARHVPARRQPAAHTPLQLHRRRCARHRGARRPPSPVTWRYRCGQVVTR